MNFIYPNFNKSTHTVISSEGVSINYPDGSLFSKKTDFNLEIGDSPTQICLIRENIGYNCEWSYVKCINKQSENKDYYDKYFYILTKNLLNIGKKQNYSTKCSPETSPNPSAQEINPIFQETFVPYIDEKNGLLSVRIQVDYDKILDMVLFNNVLENCFYEGVKILLSNRGFNVSETEIFNLQEKYYTFGYINADLDLTVRRECEPLTFTVSIPLNFFTLNDLNIQESEPTDPDFKIEFTNKNFVERIDTLLSCITGRAGDVLRVQFPAKKYNTYQTDAEIAYIRDFADSTNILMSIAGFPISSETNTLIKYSLGFEKLFDNTQETNPYKIKEPIGLKLVFGKITAEKDNSTMEFLFNESLLSQFRNTGAFHNARIINYLYNLESMINEVRTTDIIDYIEKFVNYPKAVLEPETVETANGEEFTPEQVNEFRLKFAADSEACLTLSNITDMVTAAGDLGEAVGEAVSPFSSAMYDYFIQNDPKLQLQTEDVNNRFKQAFRKMSYSKTKERFSKIQEGYAKHSVNFKWDWDTTDLIAGISGSYENDSNNSIFDNADPMTKNWGFNMNTLSIFMSRLNMHEIIFTQIYCLLKGSGVTPETSAEAAEVAADIPYEILDYIRHIRSTTRLRGWRYIKYQMQSFPWNPILTCNDELVYAIKAITKILKTITTGIRATLKLITDLDEMIDDMAANIGKARDPYQSIKKAVGKLFYKFATAWLFDFLNDLLTEECDFPGFDDSGNDFADPLASGEAPERFGPEDGNGSDDDNKKEKNIEKSLQDSVSDIVREITISSDIEYTVDIIQLFLKDLRCLLSPIESVNLLKGNPSQDVIIISKNLIRKKYFKDPNNLSYFLIGNNLIEFFKKLGKKVNKNILEQIEDASEMARINLGMTYNEVCTQRDNDIVKELINGKLPADLGVLEQRASKRIEKAKKLLDRVKNPETVVQILPLCGDTDDEDATNAREGLIDDYANSINSLFQNTLIMFNEEATATPRPFREEKSLFRLNSDGVVFETYTYNTYNSCLFLNLLDRFNYLHDNKVLYQIKDRTPLSPDQLANLMLNYQQEEVDIDKCSQDTKFVEDVKFTNFLKEGRVVYESRQSVQRDWESITRVAGQGNVAARAYREANTSAQSQFLKDMTSKEPDFFEYFKQKKTLFFISVEEDKVWFRHVLYDIGLNDFRLIYSAEFAEERDGEEEDEAAKEVRRTLFIKTLETYTGNIYYNNEQTAYIISNNKTNEDYDKEFYNDKFIEIFNESKYGESTYNRRNNLYVLSADILNFKDQESITPGNQAKYETRGNVNFYVYLYDPVNTINIIQAVFIKTETSLESVKVYESVIGSLNAYSQNGLFNIETIYSPTENKHYKVANVATSDATIEQIVYKQFASAGYDAGAKGGNFINKYHIYSMMKDSASEMERANARRPYFRSTAAELLLAEDENGARKYDTSPEVDYLFDEIEFKYKTSDWFLEILGVEAGDVAETEDTDDFKDNLEDEALLISKKKSFVDTWVNSYGKLGILNYSNNAVYASCTYLPHYINLDYFKNRVMNEAKKTLCDNNLKEVPVEMLDDVLVNVTFRVYVTDLLIKAAPFLSTLDVEDLNNLHNDQFIVDMLREIIKQEMHTFTSNYQFGTEDDYYPAFLKQKVKPIYEKYSKPDAINKLNYNYVSSKSAAENMEVDYFIRKEIKHCIYFFIDKQVITPRVISFYKDNKINKFYADDMQAIIKYEYLSFMMYYIMSCTVDAEKRAIFNGTKDEIAKIFFSISVLTGSDKYAIPTQKDIVDYLNKIAFSQNPALMSKGDFDHWAYLKFFLIATFEAVHQIVQTVAMFSDLNIFLTRLINKSLSIIGAFSWAFVETETKEKIFNEAALSEDWVKYVFFKRLDSAASVTTVGIPFTPTVLSGDVVVSGMLMGATIFPSNMIAWVYLILDTIKEAIWGLETHTEMIELKNYLLSLEVESCTINTQDLQIEKCTPEKQEYLLQELNKYEG